MWLVVYLLMHCELAVLQVPIGRIIKWVDDRDGRCLRWKVQQTESQQQIVRYIVMHTCIRIFFYLTTI
jgi:hypothetical protein